MQRVVTSLIAVLSLCVAFAATVATAADKKPDATIKLSGGSVGIGIGFAWGSGKLHYKGKTYDIDVKGLEVGDIGAAKISASGKVFNLKKVEDFNGNFTAAGAGAAVGGGGGAVIMQNQNGVKIELLSTSQGVKLALGAGGVDMTVKK